jgi:hypothetical protein
MYAAALQSVPNHGGHSGKCLALAGLHLCDVPALQCEGAQDLHVEHMQPEDTLRNHRRQRERFNDVSVPAHTSRSRLELIVS